MTSKAFRERLVRRSKSAGITVPISLADALETYVRLLTRWNAKVNLTALPLEDPTDETFDRLLIEPLVAARVVEDSWTPWIDIGSGGGSPAIPLKLVRPGLQLIMVESKARKAAFLREAIRELGLSDALVETCRFEELAGRPGVNGSAGMVSVRAVRIDSKLIKSIGRVVRPGGHLLAFQQSPAGGRLEGFGPGSSINLHVSRSRPAYLVCFQRENVPRGT